ncbi:MAG: anti-sigma factor family protein [Candidatus Saccharibacteria bacterium]
MKCQDARELLSPYIDNEVTEKEKIMLEEHLSVCAHCNKELAELRSMVDCLHQLGELQAPTGFMTELHSRLLEVKVVPFESKKTAVTPKPRWIAASVAGIAMALGVYISSVMPITPVLDKIAGIFDSQPAPNQGTSIEDIIKDIQNKHQDNQNTPAPQGQPVKTAQVDPVTPEPTNSTEPAKTTEIHSVTPKQNNTPKNNPAPEAPIVVADAKKIDTVKIQMTVENNVLAADKIAHIAMANQGQSAKQNIDVMSGKSQAVVIWVPRDRVDEVVAQIKQMGSITNPMQGKHDITAEYNEAKAQMKVVDDEIARIKNQSVISQDDQDRLKTLEYQKSFYQSQIDSMDKQAEMVEIRIVLSEEINP